MNEFEHSSKTGIHTSELFDTLLPLLEEGLSAVFTVTGMSMWPFICHGRDQVVVESCNPGDLEKGDVILFQTQLGNYMLHRITGLKTDSFETTGDGNCFRDGWFPKECVKAKVIRIVRKGKTIDCNSPWWRFVFSIWMMLFPVRGILLRALRQIGKFKSRIRKWQTNK